MHGPMDQGTGDRGLLRVLQPGLGEAYALAWSPDGTQLAVGGRRGIVVLTLQGEIAWQHGEGEGKRVYALAWSPDGHRLADGDYMGDVRVRDASTGAQLLRTRLPRRHYIVFDIAWSPAGDRLAVAGSEPLLRVHDAATLRVLSATTGHAGIVRGVSFSPDGQEIASGSD